MDRAFKGIWIPKEIWLSKELTLQEKVFLVEIDSLDNDIGCYASNSYFAEFFDLSNSRVSQVIKSLNEKGYISIDYLKDGKQILKRIVKIKRPPYPSYYFKGYEENERGYLENCNGGISFSKEGYLENCKDNNISINNTNINKLNNNISNKDLENEFETLWSMYPKKQGKKKALDSYIKCRKRKDNPVSYEIVEQGLSNYIFFIKKNKVQNKFIKHGSTWFNQECWNDDYTVVKNEEKSVLDMLQEIGKQDDLLGGIDYE